MSLKALKKAVWEANQGIFKAGLVTMHSGNASGIDRERGCMVVVRPDQYVAHVLPLDGFEPLAAFFDGFMTRAG